MDDQDLGIYHQEHFIISFPNSQQNSPEVEDVLKQVVDDFHNLLVNSIARHKTGISLGGQSEITVNTSIKDLKFIFKASRVGNSFLFTRYDIINLSKGQAKQDELNGKRLSVNIERFEKHYMAAELDAKENYIFTKDIVVSCFEKVVQHFSSYNGCEIITPSKSNYF